MKATLLALLLLAAPPALAEEAQALAAADMPVMGSHGLMRQLEGFMHERGVAVGDLTPDAAVAVMVDWMRFSPQAGAGDALLYQYSGWSEGCATAFKMSLLRRVTQSDATGKVEHLAGITLMFEPSGQSELKPYSAVSSDASSIEAFMDTIERSPAFVELGRQKPMAAMIEGGGIR
ncbi:MAG TPA: hypothetical protein VHA15_09435 [Burkholderiales bacterium]|jgi:hypothetical protein|nr:hypothetical protein [Burkholderiales bacterium]